MKTDDTSLPKENNCPARKNHIDMSDIDKAVAVLRSGGIILYPTDTVWGIGCDATNSEAVRKIYALKQRDDHKAMITLVADIVMLERTVDGIPDVAYDLIEFSGRPLTVIYDRGRNVSPLLTGDDGTLAVRLTREAVSAALCRRLGRPLVSTSANISGQPNARCFAEISEAIRNGVDYICTSRRDEKPGATPSTIMRLTEGGRFTIIRK